MIEQQPRQAGQALADQRGEAGGHNEPDFLPLPRHLGELQLALGPSGQEHIEQNQKADGLRDGRGEARARGAHVEQENQNRVQDHIQKAAGHQADHGQKGHALVAEYIIEHTAAGKEGTGQQNPHAVVPGKRQNGLGAAQQIHQRRQEQEAEDADHRAHQKSQKEAGGGKSRGAVHVVLPQAAGDVAARAVAEHKAEGLENRHQAEDDADGAGGALAQLADKVGVGHIIDAGNQHTGNGGNTQPQDQLGDRSFGHLLIFLF